MNVAFICWWHYSDNSKKSVSHNWETKLGHFHWKLPSDINSVSLSPAVFPSATSFGAFSKPSSRRVPEPLHRRGRSFRVVSCQVSYFITGERHMLWTFQLQLVCGVPNHMKSMKIVCLNWSISRWWMLTMPVNQSCSPCHVLAGRSKSHLLLSCFRVSNMKTPTGTRRQSTAMARVHQNCCLYDSVCQRSGFE